MFFGKKRKQLDMLKWSVFVFLFVFAPPIIPYVKTILVLSTFCLFTVIGSKEYYSKKVIAKCGLSEYLIACMGYAFLASIGLLTSILFYDDVVQLSHYKTICNRHLALIMSFVVIIYIIIKFDKKGWGVDEYIRVLIYAGMIEGVLCILSFIFPKIKDYFIQLMYCGNLGNVDAWYIAVRSFGYAETLVDLVGAGAGLIAGVSFFYGVYYKKRYIIYSFLIIVTAVLNARTGLLIYVVAIALTVLYVCLKQQIKYIINIVAGIGIVALCVYLGMKLLISNEATNNWVMSGINSIFLFLSTGEKVDNMGTLTSSNFWNFPSFPRIICGTGHSLYEAQGYHHSDVGYINELWIAGILGFGCLLIGIIMLTKMQYRASNNPVIKLSAIFMLLTFLIFNIKCSLLGGNIGARTLFYLYFGVIYLCKCKSIKKV